MTRRTVLRMMAACAAATLPVCRVLAAPIGRRVVSLTWATSETLFAMGIRPAAAAEIPGYQRLVGQPPTPPGVIDVGLQGAPNLELLATIAPDLILIQPWQAGLRPQLERCAPVAMLTIYAGSGDTYERACNATRRIGQLMGCPERGARLVQHTDDSLSLLRRRLAGHTARPLYLAQMIDDNSVTLFSRGSLFQAVLDRLGLRNAWSGAPDLLWGGSRVGLDKLAADPDAALVLIASPELAPHETLTRSALWRRLPAVHQRRFVELPAVWAFGALPTAEHFAHLLTAALIRNFTHDG